jgi:hypothetical protein
MYFADLTPYRYSGAVVRPDVVNVGWLALEHDFPKGVVSPNFVTRLARFISNPVNRRRGIHVCEFCPYPPVKPLPSGLNMIEPPPGTAGNGEIRVRGKNGLTYAAPVLIHHYVVKHGYLPPAEFIEAVEQAETTDSVLLPTDNTERY